MAEIKTAIINQAITPLSIKHDKCPDSTKALGKLFTKKITFPPKKNFPITRFLN